MKTTESTTTTDNTNHDLHLDVDNTTDAIDRLLNELRYTQKKLDEKIVNFQGLRFALLTTKQWAAMCIILFLFGVIISPLILPRENIIQNLADSLERKIEHWGKF